MSTHTKKGRQKRRLQIILNLLQVVHDTALAYSDHYEGDEAESADLISLYTHIEGAYDHAHLLVKGYRKHPEPILPDESNVKPKPEPIGVPHVPHPKDPTVEVPAHQYPECEAPDCDVRVFHHHLRDSKKYPQVPGRWGSRDARICFNCWFDERMEATPLVGKLQAPVPAGGPRVWLTPRSEILKRAKKVFDRTGDSDLSDLLYRFEHDGLDIQSEAEVVGHIRDRLVEMDEWSV
jgi:hypothetical protein